MSVDTLILRWSGILLGILFIAAASIRLRGQFGARYSGEWQFDAR